MKKIIVFLFILIFISGCIDPYDRVMTTGPSDKYQNVDVEVK